jgi:hypothetical protein
MRLFTGNQRFHCHLERQSDEHLREGYHCDGLGVERRYDRVRTVEPRLQHQPPLDHCSGNLKQDAKHAMIECAHPRSHECHSRSRSPWMPS